MAYQSSQPKNATGISLNIISRLLRNGSRHPALTEGIQDAGRFLQQAGLVSLESIEYIKCCNPRDADYRYTHDRSCRGRINIQQGLDEARGDYECPECSRKVYPVRHRKTRFKELTITVMPEGIASYIESRLTETEYECKKLAPYLWRCDTEKGEVRLGVVDYCDTKYLSQDWAAANRASYVVVDAAACKKRFLPDEWLIWASLAELICGKKKLQGMLVKAGKADTSKRSQASVSVYNAARNPILVENKSEKKDKKPKKRSERAETIDDLKKELHQYILTMKSRIAQSDDMNTPFELPYLTQKGLAQSIGKPEYTVSRAFSDGNDRELPILFETANSMDLIRKYSG